jgi:hypothetical protein
MKRIAILTALLLSAVSSFGQAARVDIPLLTSGPSVPITGGPLPQALWVANSAAYLCIHPSATLAACQAAPITTYTDSTEGTTCPPATPLVQLPGNTCTASTGTAANVGLWYAGGLFDYWIVSSYGTYGPFSGSGSTGTGTINSGMAYSPAYYAAGGGTVISGVTPFTGPACFSTSAAPALCGSSSIANSMVSGLGTAALQPISYFALATTTVNGHALSANVVVSASDLTTGTLPHAQLPALVSADIPANAANTSGTAGALSNGNYLDTVLASSIAFPNGTANLAADLRLGNNSYYGYIEVEVQGGAVYGYTMGKITKIFSLGMAPSNNIYSYASELTDDFGPIASQIVIGEVAWDATNSTYKIPISHITSNGNTYYVHVREFINTGATTLSLSSVYTLTALAQQTPQFNGNATTATSAAGLSIPLAHAIIFPDPNAGTVYTASQVIGTFYAPMAGTVPASGTGTYNGVASTSVCKLATAATASTTFTFADGGTSFGTVVFAASGTAGTFTISSAKAISSGDKITLTGPATADTTAAGLNCSLVFAY